MSRGFPMTRESRWCRFHWPSCRIPILRVLLFAPMHHSQLVRLCKTRLGEIGISIHRPESCSAAICPHSRWLHRERSEEHTSELQSLMRISYAVFCLKKKRVSMRYNQNEVQSTKTAPSDL